MKNRATTFAAVAVLAGVLVAPSVASASTTEAIAETGGMTLDLGGVASPLDISVTLDAIGNITEVGVAGATVEGGGEHVVRFSHNDDATRVAVQAKNAKLAADVKTSDLDELLGTHVWAAHLFGSATATQVTFEVVPGGSGALELVVGDDAVNTDTDVDYEVGEVKNEAEDDEASSAVTVTFVKDGYTMTLKIQVSMDSDDYDDDEGFSAKLKIVLRGKDVQSLRRQTLTEIRGEHVWNGHLCDGSPVSVTYTIDDVTGAVTVAEGDYELKTMPHGFVAEFNDGEAKVTVDLKEKDDGTWDLKVRSKSTDKCNPADDKDDDKPGRHDKDKKKDKDDGDDDDHGKDDN